VRFPELLRLEFPPVGAEELADGHVERAGVNGWTRISRRTRLDARAGVWSDEEDSGNDAELRFALQDVVWEHGELSLAVFATEGQFDSAIGARVRAVRRFERDFLALAYDVADREFADFTGPEDSWLQHSVQLTWDRPLGDDWDLSLYVQDQLRDDLNAITLGVTLRRSF
jgi:hypothetical protein